MVGRMIALFVGVVLISGCCSFPVEAGSMRDLEEKQGKYFAKYLGYVEKDPALSDPQKDDEKKAVEAIMRQTESLRKSIEGED